jgi:hypothetical protein
MIRVLELVGFTTSAWSPYYMGIPFVGRTLVECTKARHERFGNAWIFTSFRAFSDPKKQKRTIQHLQKRNDFEMARVRQVFPEIDSLMEVSKTMEVCP